ncbi:MAG: choice-of-anchor A family protein [Pseudodesulfovibrio sp.]|uniref:choice-of-anchor A family protein n=1 Tax=Pseudodesulfovibrio sp. TaxID=2035812 RepID=UPI003D0EDFAF
MKYSYILFSLLALILAASPARAAYIDLGVAGEYNAFIFNDFVSSNTDIEGRLAVGGSATISNFYIGSALPTGYTGNAAVVGNDFIFANGTIAGNVTVGGSASLSGIDLSAITVADHAGLPFDFAEQELYLKGLSASLGAYAATGSDVLSGSTLTLTGDGSSLFQIFNLDVSDLLNSNTLLLSGILEGSTILINVSGETANLSNAGLQALDEFSDNVLFNFYEATSLSLGSIGVEGSILAPYAAVSGGWGNIDGTLIASSYTGTMELHDNPFDGGTPVPEPGTFLIMGAGLLGLAGFMRRSKRRNNA